MHYDENLDSSTNIMVIDVIISHNNLGIQLFANSLIARIESYKLHKIENKVIILLRINTTHVIEEKMILVMYIRSKSPRSSNFCSRLIYNLVL